MRVQGVTGVTLLKLETEFGSSFPDDHQLLQDGATDQVATLKIVPVEPGHETGNGVCGFHDIQQV